MRIVHSSCRRRGTSTIMGTMIFVGIIFTAFIPMLLVMRQADTIYEIRKHELEILDQERMDEEISFYAYPDANDKIILRIKNESSTLVKIVMVWISDVAYPHDVNIKSMETKDLVPLLVELQAQTSYTVKVVTEKGNVFSSEAGTLHHSADGWYTPSLGICVHIENLKGRYQIIIKPDLEPGTEPLYEYSNIDTEHEDIEKIFWVNDPDTYYLTIKKEKPGLGFVLDVIPPYHDEPINVLWPATKPITDVYASGIFS